MICLLIAFDSAATECEDGHFGVFCDGTCHCSSGSCDKTTGHCPSGCASGWTGDNCQTDAQQSSAFTLSVGNSSDVNDHTQCASHNGAVAAGATVNESCTATGRYLSTRINGEADNHLTTLCEVVVIGHRYTITESGCDAVTTVRVEYKVDTSDSWKSVEPDKVTTTSVTIDGLSYERYEVRLVVINNDNFNSTSSSKYVVFRMTPYPIVIESVETTTLATKAHLLVNWQTITESGCDAVTAVRVEYRVAMTDSWKSVEPHKVTTTCVIIGTLRNDRYEVRLVVINNENIKSISASEYVNFRLTASPLPSTGGAAQCSASIGIGALVGTAVGSLLLGVVITAIILLGIPRIRHWKDKTDTTIQDTEMSPTQLKDQSFEDAQGYVIPPKRPQGQEGKRCYKAMSRKCTDI
ncbi:hypothetical protein NP493_2198g00000 [Ridgeia piscesae]|uniref:Fibronectin type-III domain-containing protein n=1 Tax=Ridgeia piscesae TaxID=27915 RepID=A0AAD9JJQ3_RIDPI|nr:hypothetical protein NP493_2198g00000 [Ridgeia piscesae]